MSNLPSHWLGRLANLNAARTEARGIAPHKPLMLLTVIDLIESGDISKRIGRTRLDPPTCRQRRETFI